MNLRSLLAIPSALILACSFAYAEPTLKPGSSIDISAITAAEWIKGEAPKSFEPGKLYVFECWATWCGGCIANIPHLNDLHKKYHDKGLIIHGMDVWEKDKELGVKFVEKKGDAMSYPVAYIAKDAPFDKDWLKAAGVGSIPHAFVVKDGKLLLSCHPGYLDDKTVPALLNPETCDATVDSILKQVDTSKRFVAAQYAFNDAEKKGDIAAMEKAIKECTEAIPTHSAGAKLKERLQAFKDKQATSTEKTKDN